MPAVNIIVRGRVQGVGFRYFVLTLAHQHGLDGEVWNRRDGGVEIIAAHDDEGLLGQLQKGLHAGPGRVTSVTSSPHPFPVQAGFRVGDTR